MHCKKNLLCAVILLVMTLATTGCGGKKEIKPIELPDLGENNVSERYVSNDFGFYFHYPNDWNIYEDLFKNTELSKTVLVSPHKGKDVELFSLTVVVKKYDKVKTVIDDAFLEEVRQSFESEGQEVLELKRGKAKEKYPALVAKVRKKADSKNVLYTKQLIFIAGKRLFVLTFQGLNKFFTKYEPVLNYFNEGFHVIE